MASSPDYDVVSLMSKGLYRIVSDIVGPECIVKLRRQGRDIQDDIINKCDSTSVITKVTSGSRGEGFNFPSSDVDTMHIDRSVVVLTSSTLFTAPYKKMPTILLMETDKLNVYPGFAFIKCLRYDPNNETVKNALEMRYTGTFVSSKQIRESFRSSKISRCHGPCQTFNYCNIEYDLVYTLMCPIWPEQALSFIGRSLNQGWPTYDTLTDICKEGCLLVPINNKHKKYSDMDDLQWRISFSLAEKKLIYSMNHYQFVCYGLSKIFLNEVLKKSSDEELLCSYFMKTAIFWEISNNHLDWSPLNFLFKFRNVFRRLIQWVSVGYCPNFFIPENNMFYGKMCGEKQVTLLCTLRGLYMEGYWNILRCPSLNENLSKLITHHEVKYVPLEMIELQKLTAILNFGIGRKGGTNITFKIKMLNHLLKIKTESTDIMCAVRLGINHALQELAQYLFLTESATFPIISWNRMKYFNNKAAKSILRKTKTFFCMSDFILIQQMYVTGNYHRTVEMIHCTRRKLQPQRYIYRWVQDSGLMRNALLQNLSHDTVVKESIVCFVEMNRKTTLEELIPECLEVVETTRFKNGIHIPPLVFLNFLLILSYTRLGENHRRYDALHELHKLLHRDDGYHIKLTHKALSWEILGICKQLCGYRHGAYVAYLHALDDEYNYFKQATLERINSLGNI